MMQHTNMRLTLALMMMLTTMMVAGQQPKQPPQLQQRPPQQLGGQLLPPERPQVQHHQQHLRPRSAGADDDHALRLLARAATGLAACWNATAPAPPTHLTFGPEGRCCTFKYVQFVTKTMMRMKKMKRVNGWFFNEDANACGQVGVRGEPVGHGLP